MKTENNESDLNPTPFLPDFDFMKNHSCSILSDTSDDCLEGMIVTTAYRRWIVCHRCHAVATSARRVINCRVAICKFETVFSNIHSVIALRAAGRRAAHPRRRRDAERHIRRRDAGRHIQGRRRDAGRHIRRRDAAATPQKKGLLLKRNSLFLLPLIKGLPASSRHRIWRSCTWLP